LHLGLLVISLNTRAYSAPSYRYYYNIIIISSFIEQTNKPHQVTQSMPHQYCFTVISKQERIIQLGIIIIIFDMDASLNKRRPIILGLTTSLDNRV